MGERVSKSEMARRLGVSESAVRKHVKSGLYKAGPDGLIDAEAARAAWEIGRDPDAALKGSLGGAAVRKAETETILLPETGLARARTVGATLAAQHAKIKLDRERGKLIETKDALAACRLVIAVVCERLDGLPGSVAQRVAGLDAVAVERVLRDAINQVRVEVAALQGAVQEVAGGIDRT